MVKNPTANAGDAGSVPGAGRPLGVASGTPPQCASLEKAPWTEGPGGLRSVGAHAGRVQLSAAPGGCESPQLPCLIPRVGYD